MSVRSATASGRAELARLPFVNGVRAKNSRASSALRWVFLLALFAGNAFAQANDPTPLQFNNAAEEARFHQLTAELRCVMCQNQSLADSNAQIAHDLRREVLDLMRQDKSDAEVKRFLVDRYGEFVLYKPEVTPGTWLLWFGPALLLIAGGLIVWRIVKKRGGRPVTGPDEDQEW
ncbi:cytochrome c-type biogenesis protein CcmH [Pseudoxanthomonas sp. UTMC 1351]|uniref:cytochrome c-type biogenesis protein CcmH n=1 Tax=Pseudoxanthomonas sp. UTMC 1351 TaxID=2695853 RepID=UPI0034CE2E93